MGATCLPACCRERKTRQLLGRSRAVLDFPGNRLFKETLTGSQCGNSSRHGKCFFCTVSTAEVPALEQAEEGATVLSQPLWHAR